VATELEIEDDTASGVRTDIDDADGLPGGFHTRILVNPTSDPVGKPRFRDLSEDLPGP